MAKKTINVEDMLATLLQARADLRVQADDIAAQIDELNGQILPLMMAAGKEKFESPGVGALTFVKEGTSTSLDKAKLQGNLLKYLDAVKVAKVISDSSTEKVRKAYVQFKPAT